MSEVENYCSRAAPRDHHRRERHEWHRRPGNGWKSSYHPKTLDYRTVDELGLPLEQLEEQRTPKTQEAKHYAEQVVDIMVVEGAELLRERGNKEKPSHVLTPGIAAFGEIKPVNRKPDTQYAFYRINVPDRDVPVGLRISKDDEASISGRIITAKLITWANGKVSANEKESSVRQVSRFHFVGIQ